MAQDSIYVWNIYSILIIVKFHVSVLDALLFLKLTASMEETREEKAQPYPFGHQSGASLCMEQVKNGWLGHCSKPDSGYYNHFG